MPPIYHYSISKKLSREARDCSQIVKALLLKSRAFGLNVHGFLTIMCDPWHRKKSYVPQNGKNKAKRKKGLINFLENIPRWITKKGISRVQS